VSPAKTAEPIEMQFGSRTPVNPGNHVFDGHPDPPWEGAFLGKGFSHLGSVTARQSSSGRQPNFAALNTRRHLCSAGRPSRWAFADILALFVTNYLIFFIII